VTSYADPELLITGWLKARGHHVRADPHLPANSWAKAPITHIQRGQGFGGLALTLDDVLLDFDTYSAKAETAREEAHALWGVMTFELPHATLPGNIFVTTTSVQTAPLWTPSTNGVYRRTAAYRVVLHGVV